jgi:TPP-dependent pyruvate/acetoin dehydrogenase alpha subunit
MDHAKGLPPVNYRTEEEIAFWKTRDPIVLLRKKMLEESAASSTEVDALDKQVRQDVDAAVAFARGSAEPLPEDAYDDVYATTLACQ